MQPETPDDGADNVMLATPAVQATISPPPANPPAIDGSLSPNEWENATTTALSDGSELLMMQDDDYF